MNTTQLPTELINQNTDAYASAQIYNHPKFPTIARVVEVLAANLGRYKQMFFEYQIRYFDTANNNEEVFDFKPTVKEWLVDNTMKTTLRNTSFEPMPNPEFIPIADRIDGIDYEAIQLEQYIKVPSFEYVKQVIMESNTKLEEIMKFYIQDDAINTKRFDF